MSNGNGIMIFDGKSVEIFELDGRVLFNPRDVAPEAKTSRGFLICYV